MADLDISSADYSSMRTRVDDVEIDSTDTDGISAQDETTYTNDNWSSQLGIYKTIPEFKIALDMRAIWTVGKKIEFEDHETEVTLDHISGWGKSTFRDILKNMIITKRLGEDAYAEIIKDKKSGKLINLKVLDPSTIRQVYNRKGVIKRYEQINKTKKNVVQKFQPNEIFHLTNKRIADEIHGTSDSDALKSILEANKESFDDMKKLMHRYVKPIMKFMLDTDDDAKIDAFVEKMDKVVDKGENIYVPMKTVEHDIISIPTNATLNPLPWRDHLRTYFFQVVGIPQIIMGSSGEFTESTAKIAYVAFQNSVEDEMQDIMEQVWDQLFLRIKLRFSNPLRNELISELQTDEKKDAAQGMEFQPSDMTMGEGR